MKTIEVKKGNKTIIKIVPDNYEEEESFDCRDIAAQGGYQPLMSQDDYKRIFGND